MDSGIEGRYKNTPPQQKEGIQMPIKYKIDLLPALKNAGYNTTRLPREKILSESTIQALRTGKMVSIENISRICAMLNCQPGDILEYEGEQKPGE